MSDEQEMVECSLCKNMVKREDTCSTLACRACHKSITFEQCITGTDPETLAWTMKKEAMLREYGLP